MKQRDILRFFIVLLVFSTHMFDGLNAHSYSSKEIKA